MASKRPPFKDEVRIASRNCGLIDPLNIDQYIARGGYVGLAKALQLTPKQILEEIGAAGLRDRGGEGFPTAEIWKSSGEVRGAQIYMIANATEVDPDAHAVHLLLEGDPHAVLEGMVIAAYAVGASQGYIHINSDHVAAIETVRKALRQAECRGFAGMDVLGSGFDFHVEIYAGPGDFLCGLDAAMIHVMEGHRALSFIGPRYPAASGFGGKQACLASVETLANVSAILEKGAKWFASFGSETSKGAKLITLAGKVAHPGVIEVALGTTIRQIVYQMGGGITGSGEVKALLVGGPSGGFLPASAMDLPFDYDPLREEGGDIGSGRITVAGADVCLVDLAKNNISLLKAESCGQCVMCREGTSQLYLILKDITEGKGRTEDIDLMLELGEAIRNGAACALGRMASNSVLSMMKYFRGEIEAHIRSKRCEAVVCKRLISYHILGDKCQGCRICFENCPADAIAGGEYMIHVIDQHECIRCGVCMEACPPEYGAVVKASGVKPKTPAKPIPVGTWRR
jgi:NADH-quinone oxidoreductase subunit F